MSTRLWQIALVIWNNTKIQMGKCYITADVQLMAEISHKNTSNCRMLT